MVDNNGPVVRALEAVEALIRQVSEPASDRVPEPDPDNACPLWPERRSR